MKAHSLVHSITSPYCMYEQTCIYTAYNPQSQQKKSIVGIFTTSTISPKKHSMAIILTMKHFKGTQHEQPVSPEKTFTVNTHAEKKKKTLHIFACMFFTTRQTHICTAVTHKWTKKQTHGIYCGLGCPQKNISCPQDQIFTDLLHFLSPFSSCILYVCIRVCKDVHVPVRACTL